MYKVFEKNNGKVEIKSFNTLDDMIAYRRAYYCNFWDKEAGKIFEENPDIDVIIVGKDLFDTNYRTVGYELDTILVTKEQYEEMIRFANDELYPIENPNAILPAEDIKPFYIICREDYYDDDEEPEGYVGWEEYQYM